MAPRRLDTSAVVALIVEGPAAHERTLHAVRGADLGLSGQAPFETMSVLTRVPGHDRQPPATVHSALEHSFPETRFLSLRGATALAAELAALGIGGGAVFDGLVAATAREHSLPLVTRDQRAAPIYRALGAEIRLVA